jgi:hypothetical protein
MLTLDRRILFPHGTGLLLACTINLRRAVTTGERERERRERGERGKED